MADTSEKSQAEQGVSLVVVLTAAGLLVGGVFVAPPVYERVVLGGVIESAAVRAVAWGMSGALAASGSALWGFRRRISGVELCLLGGTIVLCGVLGELALYAAGVAPLRRVILSTPALADWWERDGPWGPRYVQVGNWTNATVNAAGYIDRDEFSAEAAALRRRRVLLLGDSFTEGASASGREKSFAAILDRVLGEETVVWNMGIGGTGQRQDLTVLKEFYPILEPQLVLLSFCLNDFHDIEYPLSAWYVFEKGHGEWIRAYALGEDGTARLLSPEAAYHRAFHPMESVGDLVYASRIVTLALGAVQRLQQGEGAEGPPEQTSSKVARGKTPSEAARVETKRLLREIQEYVEGRGAAFRVMIVPFREHLDGQEQRYQTILEIAAELGLEVWEVGGLLDVADYAPEPDWHWNDSGHAKVGAFLRDKIEGLYAEQ